MSSSKPVFPAAEPTRRPAEHPTWCACPTCTERDVQAATRPTTRGGTR